jgi:uroporphyrinogen-III decarboxylase
MDLTNRERFVRLMRGQAVDRVPFFPCFGPWPETLVRWRREGLPADGNWLEICGFDGDLRRRHPVNAFLCPGIEPRVLVDEGETQIVIDSFGIRQRQRKDRGSMPEFLSFPVSNRDDWERIKPRFQADTPERLPPPEKWQAYCAANATRTEPCYAGDLPIGFFGGPRQLMGYEGLAFAFYDDPELVEDILDTLCDLWVAFFPRVLRDAPVDLFFIWEDMCFKTGPLISPALFQRFLVPRYRRFTAALRAAGVDIIMVDSDGDPRLLVDSWVDGGVTCLFPWETQMGLDITAVRRAHPTLQMIGGVNKHALALGRDAIDDDLRKIPLMLESGRYLPAVDHFVPPDVSWDNYRYFCEKLRDLIERYPPCPSS